MAQAQKLVVIGGGIAGLCTAVYGRRCGYEVEVFEQQDRAGGLATSWRRDGYTFETCLHWLLGSSPTGVMHPVWREVFDIDALQFVDPQEYAHLETENGESLSIYADVDRLEAELLARAPADRAEIRHLASAIRRLSKLPMPDFGASWLHNWLETARMLPDLPLLRHWSGMTIEEYGKRFKHPLLRKFFSGGEIGELSVLALFFSLAWMSARNAGYPIGGSQAVIGAIAKNLLDLGGRLRLGAKIEKILVEHDAAVGLQLTGGEVVTADWVISAADGHATIYDLLDAKYADKATDRTYNVLKTFPSYLQVSLGVARDLSDQPAYLTQVLDAPLMVDPGAELSAVSFRFFHFDPTFAPPGKTAVTCFLPTRTFEHWVHLSQRDPDQYQAEKHRIAQAVIAILERRIPDIRRAIEVLDVSTPASVIRYTGNWKGSMEGWLLTPSTGLRPLPNQLPGLRRLLMAGQWVRPGGGLPGGLISARAAVQEVCKQDGIVFLRARTADQYRGAA